MALPLTLPASLSKVFFERLCSVVLEYISSLNLKFKCVAMLCYVFLSDDFLLT